MRNHHLIAGGGGGGGVVFNVWIFLDIQWLFAFRVGRGNARQSLRLLHCGFERSIIEFIERGAPCLATFH